MTVRNLLAASSIVLSLILLIPAAASAARPAINLEIQAQPLSAALREFARQTGIQLAVQSELTQGKSAPALAGKYEPTAALALLLQGSGLEAYAVNEKTYGIRERGKSSPVSSGAADEVAQPGASLRMASAQSNGGMVAVEEKDKKEKPVPAQEQDALPPGAAIPEILVKNSRISNTDIKRSEDAPQPYVVFDREQIERSMATSIEEFLKTRLPMNAVSQTNNQFIGLRFGNQSSINLRGLGTNQTLVLVNGRRLPSIMDGFSTNEFNQPDVNGIPMASIERIEVLPSTASGIYGGGATGGVVNIVLKRNYTGAEFTASYDNTFASDAAQRRLDGSAGFSLEGGKTNIVISGSFADSNRLLEQERGFAQRGRDLLLRNNAAALAGFHSPLGATPNFSTLNGAPLRYHGVPLGSSFTSAPYGYAGVSSDGGAALAANAGHYNTDLPLDSSGVRQSLLNNPQKKSATLSVHREFGSRVEGFLDASQLQNHGSSAVSFAEANAFLFPGDFGNPFDNIVVASYPTPELDFDYPSDSNTTQATAGLIVRLPASWSVQGEYSWSRSRFGYAYSSPALTLEGQIALTDGTIDFTRDPNAYPFDYSNYLAPRPNFIFGPFDTILKVPTLRVGGPVMQLPGGPLSMTAMIQHRNEQGEDGFVRVIGDDGLLALALFNPHRSQSVGSAYVELSAPIVSKANARPFINDLQVQLSARRDKYRTETAEDGFYALPSTDSPLPPIARTINRVSSTDYTVGLRYAPVEAVALRMSYGTGFLPPALTQIFQSIFPDNYIFGNDPKRGGEEFFYQADVISGGNPNLRPEESKSLSAGVIITPQTLPGLRLSIDYTRIRKSDEIANVELQDMLFNESEFTDRIVRRPLSAEDIAAGYTGGLIESVDESLTNLAHTLVEAYDMQADYHWETSYGSFSAFTLLTWQPHFKRQILETVPEVDTVGFSDGVLEWRGNAGLEWQRDNWRFGWSFQYYNSYKIYGSSFPPFLIDESVANQRSRSIPYQVYHDVFIRYDFGQARQWGGMLSDTELMVGIQNVLDKDPPIIATIATQGGYSPYGDPRLRRYSLMLRKNF